MIPQVSIITVYHNNPEDLIKLSNSMKKFLPKDQYEWIVVDNNSNVNLSTQLECTYLLSSENIGFGAGCNAGAKSAIGEHLFFVNPDCEFVENCLPPLVKASEKNLIAGPQVLYPDGVLQLSYGPFLTISAERHQKSLQYRERTESVQSFIRNQSPKNPDYVSGCAMMLQASNFHSLYGFDEKFFLYNEDVDLCKRAQQKGIRSAYIPEARIQHTKSGSAKHNLDRASQEYRKSQLLYYRKHHGAIQNFLLRTYLRISGKMPAST
ncbi:glycosyltransferase family 2 protein [bacterium]|nr:glycosyltransferase family 2 protein [bacterium]MCI0617809.1 glycosyltransferase family 2 protein [bacterium]